MNQPNQASSRPNKYLNFQGIVNYSQRNFQPADGFRELQGSFRSNVPQSNTRTQPAKSNPIANQSSNPKACVNQIIVESKEDDDQIAHVHAPIKHQGKNHQFSTLQTRAQYEGKKIIMLIDFGSTHSLISPKCLRNLEMLEQSSLPLTMELAMGKHTKICTSIGELKFTL